MNETIADHVLSARDGAGAARVGGRFHDRPPTREIYSRALYYFLFLATFVCFTEVFQSGGGCGGSMSSILIRARVLTLCAVPPGGFGRVRTDVGETCPVNGRIQSLRYCLGPCLHTLRPHRFLRVVTLDPIDFLLDRRDQRRVARDRRFEICDCLPKLAALYFESLDSFVQVRHMALSVGRSDRQTRRWQ